jgi:two-component system response regulator MprA
MTSPADDAGRILVVDDDELVRILACTVLEHAGYVVDSASDGAEALEKIDAMRPDLVLLDLMMPRVDGWSVLQALERRPARPRVLILSAHDDRGGTLDGEVIPVIRKPFRYDELLNACARALMPA